jgi:hypothetical protein
MFSYKPEKLAEEPLYQVRFHLGDTDEDTATFQDEEIKYALSCNNDDVLRTCIACITALLPRLAQHTEFTVGPYSEKSSSSAYSYWTKMLDELKAKVSGYGAPIMMPPSGPSIFHYGMLGVDENAGDP